MWGTADIECRKYDETEKKVICLQIKIMYYCM